MLKIGIIGFPNVGKSTLFKALTKQKVDISNYPFCTIDPNVGVVSVPDERLDQLKAAFPKDKVIPAVVEFVDIAGLVKGASKGEGLGNKFLANIREVDAILHVVRVFEKQDIIHVANRINPEEDIEIVNTELILSDLETVDKTLKKKERKDLEILSELKEFLEQGNLAKDFSEEVEDLFLLTSKPILYLYNYSDKLPELGEGLKQKDHLFLDVKIEEELSDMEEDIGIEPKIGELIKRSYSLLDLITFFTMNENELRAWQVKRDSTVPQAGGVIHTDFEEKFIKAEAIQWDRLIQAGDWHKAREQGVLRTHGKDYLVNDGDVVYFLI